jgi:hypothetical protein
MPGPGERLDRVYCRVEPVGQVPGVLVPDVGLGDDLRPSGVDRDVAAGVGEHLRHPP